MAAPFRVRFDWAKLGNFSGATPTGPTATGAGTAVDLTYLVATDADALDVPVGATVMVYTSTGAVKEDRLFTVTGKTSAFGFTNITVTPNFATGTVAGDVLKVMSAATAGYADVTDLVRGAITCSVGRDQATALTAIAAGRGQVQLDNTSRRFSPGNASSPLFGNLKPARPVLIERTVAGSTYTILRAHTDDTPINPDVAERRAGFTLVDTLADFRGPTISTQLYQGLTTGQAIGIVLDAIGWPGGRDLDQGSTIMPWWWEDGADALDALQRIMASEGAPALLTIGTSGEVIFRDRQHRGVRAASTTSQATWRGEEDSAEPVMGLGFTRDDAWRNVINDVQITVNERQPDGSLSQVWTTDEQITIPASQSRVVVLQTTDPFQGAVAPVAGVDYELLSGGLSSTTLSRTSGASTSITLTAGGSGARLSGLALRAYSVPVRRQYQVTDSDATSIADYGRRGLPSGAEPVWCNRYDAQDLASLYVLQRKQPLPVLSVRFIANQHQTTRLQQLLVRDLSDRVTVIEPETGTSGAYFIESITHTVSDVTGHEIVFGLEAAPAAPSNPFILGTSTLNGSATLGY